MKPAQTGLELFAVQFARERDRGATEAEASRRAALAVDIARREGTAHDVGRKVHAAIVGAEVSDALTPADREREEAERALDADALEWSSKGCALVGQLARLMGSSAELVEHAYSAAVVGQLRRTQVLALRDAAARLELVRRELARLIDTRPALASVPSDFPGPRGARLRTRGGLPARYRVATMWQAARVAAAGMQRELFDLASILEELHLPEGSS